MILLHAVTVNTVHDYRVDLAIRQKKRLILCLGKKNLTNLVIGKVYWHVYVENINCH
jgi:hypothetical protein